MTVPESLIQFGFEPITEWVMKGPKIGMRNHKWKITVGGSMPSWWKER